VLTTADSQDIGALRSGQAVAINPPSTINAGIIWGAYVASDGALTVRLANVTALAIDPSSGEWTFQGTIT